MTDEKKGADEVLYEGAHSTVGRRFGVSLGTAGTLVAVVGFVRWGLGGERALRDLVSPGVWALAGAIAVVMCIAALRSRVVWRVTLEGGGHLRMDRDPGAVERFALAEITRAESAPAKGGWSRDPSEKLILHHRDGQATRWELPDDADTPGVARDINTGVALAAGGPR